MITTVLLPSSLKKTPQLPGPARLLGASADSRRSGSVLVSVPEAPSISTETRLRMFRPSRVRVEAPNNSSRLDYNKHLNCEPVMAASGGN